MKETIKYDNWMKFLTVSVIVIIVSVFTLTVTNTHLAKGTFSAETTCSDFYDGPTCESMGCSWSVTTGCTGTVNPPSSSVPPSCAINWYLSGGKCVECPNGYKSSGGSSTICYISCSANTYLASANATSCTQCSNGKTSKAHNVNYGNTSSCTCVYPQGQTQCESAQTGRKCSLVGGCYVPDGCKTGYTDLNGICAPSSEPPTCSSDRTYYPTGEPECESKSNGYVCSCDLKFCCKVTTTPLGGDGYECTNPGGFKGTCGQSTLRVCQGGGQFSCKLGSSTYTYTCQYEGTDANGLSISNCTLNNTSTCSSLIPSGWILGGESKSSCITSAESKCGTGKYEGCQTAIHDEDNTISCFSYKCSESGSGGGGNISPNPTSTEPPKSTEKPTSTQSAASTEKNVPSSNPQTGTAGIIVAWIVGLVAIVYALWYFRKSSSIK